MKKYILGLLSIVTFFFSSCSNDEDIEIAYNSTFKIMPSSVIASFKPYYSGDFDLDSGDKLRTSIFIYNEAGNLLTSETAYLNGYSENMTFSVPLPAGNYTVVATTDVVTVSNQKVSFEYWLYEDFEKLTTFKITDTGYVGYDDKILGVSSFNIEVNGQKDISIPVQPAGALIIAYYEGIHYYSDVVYAEFSHSRKADYIYFDINGSSSVNIISSGSFSYRKSYLDLTSSYYDDSNNIYSYCFNLPDPQFECRFYLRTDDGSGYNFDIMKMNLQAGQQYLVKFNFENRASDYTLTNSASASASQIQLPAKSEKQVLKVKDIVTKDY